MSDPRVGIPSAEIMLAPSGPVYLSDASGGFVIMDLPTGSATVITSKAGFLTDTVTITVPAAATLPLEIQLDALPVIAQAEIITKKLDEYFPGPTYLAQISADIGDPDGLTDFDSAWSVIGDIWVPMTYSPISRLFEATVFDFDLPTNNLQWLVGRELRIVARDQSGALAEEAGLFLTRIIEESALPVSPALGDTTGPSPLLRWNPAPVTFFHTLTLEIVRQDAGTQTPIWSQALVDAGLQEFQYSGALTPGSYFWTVAVVDEFGNMCRSKPSSFLVN